MKKFPMTTIGLKTLQKKLHTLKNTNRPKIIEEIKKARAHGDLKENAEYQAAKEEQYLIETKIKDIETKLAYANIIDITTIPITGKIIFGTTVKLINLETKQKLIYQIVGEDEANIKQNKISINSPIAKALIGQSINSNIEIKIPTGILKYNINNIQHI